MATGRGSRPPPTPDAEPPPRIDTSTSTSSSRPGRFDDANRPPGDAGDRSFHEGYTMAAKHTHQSTPSYSSQQPFHPNTASHSARPSAPALPSPVEARRTSDDSEPSHRQHHPSRLPSIRDMDLIPGANPDLAPQPSSSYAAIPPRPFPDSPSESRFPPRPEYVSTYSSRSRQPTEAAAPPPLSMPGLQQPAIQSYVERDKESNFRLSAEAAQPQLSRGFSHTSQQRVPAPQPLASLYPHSGHLPPGQYPLPGISPASPRQPNSALQSPFDTGRPPIYPDDDSARIKYQGTLGRAFDTWAYVDSLAKVRRSRSLQILLLAKED